MAGDTSKVYVLVEGDHEARFTDPGEAGAAFFHADRTMKPYVYQGGADGAIGSERFIATTQAVGEKGSDEGMRYKRKVPHSHTLAEEVQPRDAESLFREGYFTALEGAVKQRIEEADGPFSQDLLDDIEELRREGEKKPEVGQSLPPENSIELVADRDFDLDEVRARAAENRKRDGLPSNRGSGGSSADFPLPVEWREQSASADTAKTSQGNKGGSNSIEELESLSGNWRDRYDIYENRKQTDYRFKGTDDLAFYHAKRKIEVAAPSPQVAEDIVALASELGWSKIKVNGEDDFKHDVWKAAQKAGIEVEGYNPNNDERVGSSRKLGNQRQGDQPQQQEKATTDPATSGRDVGPKPNPNPVADFARAKAAREEKGAEDSEPKSDDPTCETLTPKEPAAGSPVELSAYHGKLVGHGTAPYQNNPDNSQSYYAELEDDLGHVRTVWGKQIDKALDECGANPGDHIELWNLGKTPVEVDVPKFNQEGECTGYRKESRLRNEWKAKIQDAPEDRDTSRDTNSKTRSHKPKM
ncbi:hypothetical protein DYI26_19280 [Halomonas litopenaei]|nr:hypothetical protein [Halomonas litopenaei]